MLEEELIFLTEDFVRKILGNDESGHDWWHILRVRNLALSIGKMEGADLFIVEMAALLHDVDDWKLRVGLTRKHRAKEWLLDNGIEPEIINKICDVIYKVSFKGANVNTPVTNPECAAVQDADRLDAIGAIGIARTFAYGGSRGRSIYDPDVPPVLHNDFEEYKNSKAPTINHFYEKLLLLKDRMQTKSGRAMAEQRHEFMVDFLDQFYSEWNTEFF